MELENNLFLVYSKIQRTAEIVAKSFVQNLTNNKIREMDKINSLVKKRKEYFKKSRFK